MSSTPTHPATGAKSRLANLARGLLGEKAERIAIVGMACRFPGAESIGEFRDLLAHGIDAITDVPAQRWNADTYHADTPGVRGKTHVRQGGFCAGFEEFDNELFGLSPREADTMDPQHRVLLEVAWEAMSSAGLRKDSLAGTPAGVFIGISTFDYYERFAPAERDAFMSTGLAHSAAAGRLAYYFDLKGAAESIDTACSSGLVAVHRACHALRSREVDTAFAGGVNAMFSPSAHISFSHAGMLSADGRCRTFDDSADGYGRGEGCGVIVLKRLADAQRDGDQVLAVIAGSAVNHNGRSQGMTAPNGPAQQAVIRRALDVAGLTVDQLGYIEAHGTGTPLGDPIELNALSTITKQGSSRDRLAVGSVKTNIGHLEAGAGIAGLIKAILITECGEIFPQLHLRRTNAHLALDRTQLCLTDVRRPLPAGRSAVGVSSFGFSGTNAHVVVEPCPPSPVDRAIRRAGSPELLQISARSLPALRDLAARLARHLDQAPSTPLDEVAAFLRRGDALAKHRFAWVARTHADASAALRSLAANTPLPAGAFYGLATREPKVALLFTGQGSQYSGMAQQLYRNDAVFRARLDEVAEAMVDELDRPLLQVLFDPALADELDDTRYCQPALFAVEYALALRFRDAGVEPVAVLGHSVGEIVAAAVAQILTLPDAARLICRRGALMQSTEPRAAMLTVSAGADDVRALLDGDGLHDVAVAAVNGPGDTVISGALQLIERAQGMLSAAGVRHRRLSVTRAFHSALMDDILAEFHVAAEQLRFSAPQITVVSNVTGAPLECMSAQYLCAQLRQPVQFHQGVTALQDMPIQALVEIGPTPHLAALIESALRPDLAVVPTLRPGLDDGVAVLGALARLHCIGVPIAAAPDVPAAPAGHAPPVTAFDRRTFLAAASGRPAATPSAQRRFHPWLSVPVPSPLSARQFPCDLAVERHPMLADHRVYGLEVFPATGFIDLVAAAAREVTGMAACTIRQVRLLRALVVSDGATEVQLVLHPESGGDASGPRFRWEVLSRQSAESWLTHADGTVEARTALASNPVPDNDADMSVAESMEPDRLYSLLRSRGLAYTGSFRGLTKIWRGEVGSGISSGSIQPPQDSDGGNGHIVHPAVLDAALQLVSVAMTTVSVLENSVQSAFIPVSFDAVHILAPLTGPADAAATVHRDRGGMLSHADVEVIGPLGTAVRIEGMRLQPVSRQQMVDGEAAGDTVGDLLAALRDLPTELREAQLRTFLTERVAEILDIPSADVDPDAPYFELGMTSLAGMELQYSIRRRLNCTLPSALVLDFESTDTLVGQLLDIVDTTIRAQGDADEPVTSSHRHR
ncbi:type I polyketide synthase [Mycolicibacterium bacteremicum]|uniref:type I polyketide synthase n=1 Tax=Mycolicibacterium bacteremicum TaxID=564198 RepID=UPI0026EF9E62|nr:beta-ketoacyl synthase N-terminal-like domain-containing protein [Mycolicibacterium bacteremicum]